ncbi:hypothetical protein MTBBW1_1490007 [Desulfamplus magnetovallimortis]|uniref:Uncharacterized protein n=1 Tax=Desulfamplus magnetovallimortis TaxID=1246637 RepID=A0A1W1H8C5_9BACT|nr:hypothetical protein [Desulfamplus magnetovallimortis]SLM28727.1 hypothetical protein MTBBW1_1490007 [Desulfamplus magnetovallimortis]
MLVNERFPVLSFTSKMLFFIGCLILFLGIISGVLELIEFFKFLGTEGGEWFWSKKDIFQTATCVICVIWGLMLMIMAEMIGVLFAIEKNTRS